MFPTKNKTINRWAAFLVLIFLVVFTFIWGRFFYIAEAKNVSGHNLVSIGKNQWTTVKLVDAQRGEILGRDGEVLAHDVPAYTVYAVLSHNAPSYVKNKEQTAQELAPILNTNELTLLNYLNSKNYQIQFGTAGSMISYAQMVQIQKLNLPGIGFIQSSKRDYPNNAFASYVLGFTTQSSNTSQSKGVYGIEQSLNSYLSEQDGTIRFYSDSSGNLMPEGTQKIKKPKNGDNVTLTLDPNVQSVLEETMSQVQKEYNPKDMVAIAADPKTGAILAMSTRPTFNPNTRDITEYYNDAIANPFEPGSVMKTFTLAAAINEGVWNSNATYPSGHYTVPGATVHDWDQGWGTITYLQGLERSSNVAFSRIEDLMLGPTRFYKYLQAFGFTKETGIDLPGEGNSIINFKTQVDQVMTSFGQGSAVTPIQIVQAATAIANNGTMMKPYIIQKIEDPSTHKVIINTKPTVAGHPVTAATAIEERGLLRDVVDPNIVGGTGHQYDIPGYQVIGKTGTAQIAEHGQYLTGINNYVFSFLGMAPEKDPKLIVYVAIQQPNLKQSEGYSAEIPISKIFNPVMKTGLEYMDVAPSNDQSALRTAHSKATVTVDNWTGQSITQAQNALEAQGLKVVALGSGTVTAQSLSSGMSVFKGSQIVLLGQGQINMPDISNWTLNEVLSLTQMLDLKLKYNGSGFVIAQSITSGNSIQPGSVLSVTLKSSSSSTNANASTSSSSGG